MALVFLYLALAWVAGVGLTFAPRLTWDLEGRLATGLGIGCAAAALCSWVAAIPTGMSAASVATSMVALLAINVAIFSRASVRITLRQEADELRGRWQTGELLPLALLAGATTAYFAWFFTRALDVQSRGIAASYESVYWDWPHHLGLTTYLATAQHLLPPSNPWYSGINLNYSFLTDLLSATLTHFGASAIAAVEITSVLLASALVIAFYSLIVQLSGSRHVAMLAIVLVFLSGGLGFVDFLGEVTAKATDPVSWIQQAGARLASPVHDYTFDQITHWWYNPVVADLIPQRNVLLGWPLGFITLRLFWAWWRGGEQKLLVRAGCLVGLIPLFHVNTYLALMVFAGGLFLLSFRRWPDWLRFALPAVLVGGVLTAILLPPAEIRSHFIHFQFEWVATNPGSRQNLLAFWPLQTVLFLPLAAVPFFFGWLWPPGLRRFLLPAWLLFFVANLIVLQPNAWDNQKTLVWWAMLVATPAALVLVWIARRGRFMAALVAVVLVLQSLTGLIDIHRTIVSPASVSQLQILDSDGVDLAKWSRDSTVADSLFLTSTGQNHPIRVLGGRRQVYGGEVSLVGLGIDSRQRLADVAAMLRGDPGTENYLRYLGVDYVVDDPSLDSTHFNDNFYRSHYSIVYSSPHSEYTVFRVRP